MVPDGTSDRNQTCGFWFYRTAFGACRAIPERRGEKASVETIDPAVVGTFEVVQSRGGRLQHHGGPVTADVMQDLDLGVVIAT